LTTKHETISVYRMASTTHQEPITLTTEYIGGFVYKFGNFEIMSQELAAMKLGELCPNRTQDELADALAWAKAGSTVRVHR
jgi:phage terminase large subunit-like protein